MSLFGGRSAPHHRFFGEIVIPPLSSAREGYRSEPTTSGASHGSRTDEAVNVTMPYRLPVDEQYVSTIAFQLHAGIDAALPELTFDAGCEG